MSEYKILLVEDTPHWRKILNNYIQTALDHLDCQGKICEAENLEQAWDKLENDRWDLLCTDIGLSEVSRENAGALLVNRSSEKGIPTIIVSGTPSVTPQNVRDFLKEDKVVDFFYKQTFNTTKFVELVQRLLSESRELPRKSIFICYAHADNENTDPMKCWLDRFLIFIKPLILQEDITVLSDNNIGIGDDWHTTIQKCLSKATAAVLMVSPNFLNSEYIRNNELPVLLKDANIRGVKIFPIIISPCLFKYAVFKYPSPKIGPLEFNLSTWQTANPPSKTLVEMNEGEQNRILEKVAEELAKVHQGTV